ncbi:MAG: S24/S26 family peptidase [Pseudomonadota bacterium]
MRPTLARVRGGSMLPAYRDGDVCLALPLPRSFFGRGSVALFDHPAYGLLIKRVNARDALGIRVNGDNPRHDAGPDLGTIPWSQVRGRVVLRLAAKA